MKQKQLAPTPGELLSPRLTWHDLVLPDALRMQLQSAGARLRAQQYRKTARLYGPNPWKGSQFLFHGPVEGAKLLAAQLMASDLGLDLWLIPSPVLLGRYIGETEKNINRVFHRAARSGWVLFFDEADALFGRRTRVQSGNDHYASIEISHLLQAAEAYRGPVVLSMLAKPHLGGRDQRRFEGLIEFQVSDS